MKHCYALVLLLLVLANKTLFAQATFYTLSGTVTETSTGAPLAGAAVAVQNTYLGAATNANGQFAIERLKPGNYTLTVQLLGYQPYTQNIALAANQRLTIELTPQDLLLQEALVRGIKASQNTATTYTNLSRAQIEPINLGQDMPFLLQQTPSVVVTSDAGAGIGYTGMRIRGTDATRINVTVNGIPINDAESHSVFWVNMPDFASSTHDIQIQRGVGTSTNGAGAFGASVNMQTSRLSATPYTELNTSVGSFNTQRYGLLFGTGLVNERFSLDGRLSSITSNGYVDRASANLQSFFLSGAYYGKQNSLKATVFWGKEITYQAWGGVPQELLKTQRTYNAYTYDNQVDDYQQRHYQLHYNHQLHPNWLLSAALHYTQGAGFYEEYQPEQLLSDYGLQNTGVFSPQISGNNDTLWLPVTTTNLIRRKWLDNDFYGAVYSLAYSRGKLNTTLGGGINRYNGLHFGEVIWAQYAANGNIRHPYYQNQGDKYDGNVYWKTEYSLNARWSLFADLQYRHILYRISGNDEDRGEVDFNLTYRFFNPKAGVNYAFNANSRAFASVALAHREPTRSNIIDNNELPTAERLLNIETGYHYQLSRFALQANYYLMHYQNQLVLTGNLNDVGYPIQQNVPQSYRTGFELSAQVTPAPKWQIQANLTSSINKITEFTQLTGVFDPQFNYLRDTLITYRHTDISFSPNLIANGSVVYTPVKWASVSLLGNYVSRQFLDNTGTPERSLNPYFFTNLLFSCRWQPAKWVKNIEASLLLNNVFNTLYESNGWTYFLLFEAENGIAPQHYNHYYPQAGINWLAGLKIGF